MVKIIKNGRVIDPESRFDGRADLWIENGKIQKIVKKDTKAESDGPSDAPSIPVQTSAKAPTTPFLLRLTVPLSLRDSAKTAKRSVFTRSSSKLKHLPKKAGFSLPFFV